MGLCCGQLTGPSCAQAVANAHNDGDQSLTLYRAVVNVMSSPVICTAIESLNCPLRGDATLMHHILAYYMA